MDPVLIVHRSEVVTERDISSASDALERVRSDLVARQGEAQRTGVLEVRPFESILNRG